MAYDKDEEYEKVRIGFTKGCLVLMFIAALIVILGIEVAAFALMTMLFGML
jgi:hypothetical protein